MTENRFNAKLSAYFRKTRVHYVKINDRVTVGVSDFLIWHEGMSAGLEVKKIDRLPCKSGAKVLSHPFSKPQTRFLKNMQSSGNLGYGLIVVHEEKLMYLVRLDDIRESGNWTIEEFNSDLGKFRPIKVTDFKALFRGIFYDDEQIRRII